MRIARGVSVFTALALGLGTASLHAQSGTINATATVLSAITVNGAKDLDFGNVTPGVNKAVAITDAGAGRFDVTKAAATAVALTFTLPANLTSGGNNLPIGSWTGGYNTSNSPVGATGFTPSAAATNTGSVGNIWVFIGATVSPGAGQAAGAYTGAVTMQVAYL
jgi:hypothetical protein